MQNLMDLTTSNSDFSESGMVENRLLVAKGEEGGRGLDWEFRD